jgi:hypothetical protein
MKAAVKVKVKGKVFVSLKLQAVFVCVLKKVRQTKKEIIKT